MFFFFLSIIHCVSLDMHLNACEVSKADIALFYPTGENILGSMQFLYIKTAGYAQVYTHPSLEGVD